MPLVRIQLIYAEGSESVDKEMPFLPDYGDTICLIYGSYTYEGLISKRHHYVSDEVVQSMVWAMVIRSEVRPSITGLCCPDTNDCHRGHE